MISILGEHKPYEFPQEFDNGLRLKDFLEDEVEEKYYISSEKTKKLISQIKTDKRGVILSNQATKLETETETASTLLARDYKGFGNQGMTAVVVPCLTPDRLEKRQNGRRFKEDGEPMFTLTGQDRHGVLQIGNYREKEAGFTNPQTGRVYSTDGCSPTLNTMQGGDRQPKILYNYRIRKLTPKECFRLMGLHDDEIDKIQSTGISNSQQYKLAGNSIVVDVLEALFKQLFLK